MADSIRTRSLIFLGIPFALLGLGFLADKTPGGGPSSPPSAAVIAQDAALGMAIRAKRLLKERLKDPDSAQFKTVLAKADVACGLYNAKNSFGGYGEYDPFLGLGYPETVVYIYEDKGFTKLWKANCTSAAGFTRID